MAEAIPGIPKILEVTTQSEPGNFNLPSTRGEGLRAGFHISSPSVFKSVTGYDHCGGSLDDTFKIGDNYSTKEFDAHIMEKQAAVLEKELIMKELETLDFLEALGSTKKIVQDLKLELQKQALRSIESQENQSHCCDPLMSLAEELNSLRLKPSPKRINECDEEVKMVIEETIRRVEIMRKLEEANEEVKQSKQALETALNRVEIAKMKQLEAEDKFRQWNIESWKDKKAIRAKSPIKGDNVLSHVSQQLVPLIDLSNPKPNPKPMLKRSVSFRNVLNRKEVPTVDEKRLVTTPRRKFRFIHVTVPLLLEKQSKQTLSL